MCKQTKAQVFSRLSSPTKSIDLQYVILHIVPEQAPYIVLVLCTRRTIPRSHRDKSNGLSTYNKAAEQSQRTRQVAVPAVAEADIEDSGSEEMDIFSDSSRNSMPEPAAVSPTAPTFQCNRDNDTHCHLASSYRSVRSRRLCRVPDRLRGISSPSSPIIRAAERRVRQPTSRTGGLRHTTLRLDWRYIPCS